MPVAYFIAAVMPHTRLSDLPMRSSSLPKASVNVSPEGAELFFVTAWYSPGFSSAGFQPFPFVVNTCTTQGRRIIFATCNASIRSSRSWPLTGPMYWNPKFSNMLLLSYIASLISPFAVRIVRSSLSPTTGTAESRDFTCSFAQ